MAVDGAIFDRRTAALAFAARFGELAMHVDQIFAPGAFVQVIDILRAEKIVAGELGFELSESDVRRIGRGFFAVGAALGIKIPDQRGIASQSFRRADFLHVVSGP